MNEIIREVSGFLMIACFMLCYIPQILKIYKNKSSKDVSLMLVFMSMFGYIFGLIYLFTSTFGLWWLINYITGLTMCVILIHSWFKFNNNDE